MPALDASVDEPGGGIVSIEPLPPPDVSRRLLPPPWNGSVPDLRETVRKVLAGEDDRLLLILRPELRDRGSELLETARSLTKDCDDAFVVVLLLDHVLPTAISEHLHARTKSSQPPTRFTDEIRNSRTVLVRALEEGLGTAHRIVDVLSTQYIDDLTVLAQVLPGDLSNPVVLELASTLPFPVIFTLSSMARIDVATNALLHAARRHHFLTGRADSGVAIVESTGNADCFVMLALEEAISEPLPAAWRAVSRALMREGLGKRLLIDADRSDGGSSKVFNAIVEELGRGSADIAGVAIDCVRGGAVGDNLRKSVRGLADAVRRRRGGPDALGEDYGADRSEEALHEHLSAGDVAKAESLLVELTGSEPTRQSYLEREFGFLLPATPGGAKPPAPEAASVLGANLWRLLASNSTHEIEVQAASDRDDISTTEDPTGTEEARAQSGASTNATPPTNRDEQSAYQRGDTLEECVLRVLRSIFDVPSPVPRRLRRQHAGAQYGHDLALEFEASAADKRQVRCHVECKNYSTRITLQEVADKILQEDANWQPGGIDHWILISPATDPSNELTMLLEHWEANRRFPFTIQVWSPESRVQDLFALDAQAHATLYRHLPDEGRTFGSPRLRREDWLGRLVPRTSLGERWEAYLDRPSLLCHSQEDPAAWDQLFRSHVLRRGADAEGVPLSGALEDHARKWLEAAGPSTLVLLAEFGDGKSAFTYILARRLIQGVRARTPGARIPLRFSLHSAAQHALPRDFVVQRLSEVGLEFSDWRRLCEEQDVLAVLDGFDEMSRPVDAGTLMENARKLKAICTELSHRRVKILITSRAPLLDPRRDVLHLLPLIGNPMVLRLLPLTRAEVQQDLQEFAFRCDGQAKMRAIHRLYDSIGLATKPLFLQLIKAAFAELPEDRLDSSTLYETFIQATLKGMLDDLADKEANVLDSDLLDNLVSLLEEIAVRLNRRDQGWVELVDLHDRHGQNLCLLLWRMTKSASARPTEGRDRRVLEEDATGRVGLRSLLIPIAEVDAARWPVKFFNRSVQEFLVARHLARLLLEDEGKARTQLDRAMLSREVTHFAATCLRAQDREAAMVALHSLAKSALRQRPCSSLGGNAVTMLHALCGRLPASDWNGLNLDDARLAGGDLSAMSFQDTSLRNAELYNADLTNVDFSNADLRGVAFEETAVPTAIAVVPGAPEKVVAAYDDGAILEWNLSPMAQHKPLVVRTDADRDVVAIAADPAGHMALISMGHCSVSWGTTTLSRFRIKENDGCHGFFPGVVCFERETGGRRMLVSAKLDDSSEMCLSIDGPRPAALAPLGGLGFVVLDEEGYRLRLVRVDGGRALPIEHVQQPDGSARMLAVTTFSAGERNWMLAAGCQDGVVIVWRLSAASTSGDLDLREDLAPLFKRRVHYGPVTAMAFLSDAVLATGGGDRAVAVFSVDPMIDGRPESRLHLTLRCEGVKLDGMDGPEEKARLAALANRWKN